MNLRIPLLALFLAAANLASGQSSTPAITGVEVPELAVFDRIMTDLITKYKIPGGALAVIHQGRLILARGYGQADRSANLPVQPFSLFRLASISKSITAVATMKLVQDGKLRLDARLTDLLPDLQPAPGQTLDARYRQVTVQHLLHHTYGQDNAMGGDPAFRYADAQRAFSGAPHSVANMVRFGYGLPLSFEPGARYSYSNLGYHLLGRVIEKAAGKPYESYVREDILAPMGITAMRIARPTEAQRVTDEVKYYDFDGAPARTTLIAGQSGNAPRPYGGGFLADICESYGGWIASPVDLMRFITAIDGRRNIPALLTPASIQTMLGRPSYVAANAASYYAMGWNSRPVDATRFNMWHSGSLPGTRTYLVSFGANGRGYAALFNMRPPESEAAVQEGAADPFIIEVDRNLGAAFGQVTRYPTHDLFPSFARESLNTSAEALSFQAQAGGEQTPETQTLNLTSSGAPIYASVSVPGSPAWLRIDRMAGYTPVAIRVSVAAGALPPGEYSANLQVVSTDARNSPRAVPVRLRVTGAAAVLNGASLEPGPLAPGALAAVAGDGFAENSTVQLGAVPLAVVERTATRLTFAIPEDTPLGPATLTITTGTGELRASVTIEALAPGLFSANRTGQGPALAVLITGEEGSETVAPVYECAEGAACVLKPIDLAAAGPNSRLRLTATGIRGRADLSLITAKIGDLDVEVLAATAGENPGEDLVTLRIPAELAGRGELDAVIRAGERVSNAVKVSFAANE